MNKPKKISVFRACLFISPMVLALAVSASSKSIGKDQTNIRAEPNLNSPILFTAPLGYPIEIKKENGDWLYIADWQNTNGWVYRPLVSDIETAVILVDKANVRSAANPKSQVVANAEMGEIYSIITKNGQWVQLGYYQDKSVLGWIRDDLVFGD